MDLATIAAVARTVTVRQDAASGEVLFWRVRRLDPKQAIALVGIGVVLPDATGSDFDDEAARAEAEAKAATPADPMAYLAIAEQVACACVDAVSDDGEAWTPLRLVEADEDPSAGRLLVSTLPPEVLANVVLGALQGCVEGRAAIAPFRGRRSG